MQVSNSKDSLLKIAPETTLKGKKISFNFLLVFHKEKKDFLFMAYDQPSMKPLMKSEMPVFTKNSAVKKFKKKLKIKGFY